MRARQAAATPIAVTMLMGVSPMAPAWYVLALALIGLGLGIWLRQDWVAAQNPVLAEEIQS